MYRYGKKLINGADGFLLKHNDVYYLYCTTENDLPFFDTNKNDGDGIEVYTSKDLQFWKNEGFCLKKGENVIGEHWFWAPEVSFYNGKFYMVYAADEKVAIAVSETPNRPFKKNSDNYLFDKHAIDGHLLFDDDGTVYLYYADLSDGNRIMVAKMSADLTKIEEEYENILIAAEEPWETIDCKVTEGPFVIKHNGTYYLFYSANHTRSQDYSVGYAISDCPTGPFKKHSKNPILHKFDNIVGTGHHSFMPTDNVDKYIMTYHCHGGNVNGFKPRKICFAEAEFVKSEKGNIDEIVINQ